jgi:hypothetical protein
MHSFGRRFDDLTGTALAGHSTHRRRRHRWVLCLYRMSLNLSNRQIAQELGLSGSDVQAMTEHLRTGRPPRPAELARGPRAASLLMIQGCDQMPASGDQAQARFLSAGGSVTRRRPSG